MDSKEFLTALELVAKEKGIDKELIFEAIEASLVSACKKHFGANQNIKVDMNRENGEVKCFTQKTIVETVEEVIFYAKELQNRGAKNVLVSLGKEGAVLVAENGQIYESEAPQGKVINSVGAGDSMVAGFLAEYI